MQCPVCKDVTLVMADRQGIEIDYCPTCRGVWLDRGELDKIIDRSMSGDAPPAGRPAPRSEPVNRPHDAPRYYEKDDDKYYGHRRKRKGFLGDLFDFD